ncbi:MAG: cation diffusion facilitator family transporter [Patescibacteria group bacterium]|nr:cation diffusion facilitator family transporter [Patescibacteria group bacterium]
MNLNKKLKVGMAANTAFAIAEIIVGLASGSLALVSDAVHNLTDSLSILIAFVGQKIAQRPATEEHTFGYGKATILTALVNSLILIAIAGFIFYEAYQKILHPSPVKGGVIMLVAGIGILVNGGVAAMFAKDRNNLNMRGVFLNMAFDTLVSLGAVFAGLVILVWGKTLADPVISMAIGVMLVYGSIQIVNQAIHILLEGIPENLKPKEIIRAVGQVPNIVSVDNFHLWSIASQKPALSCHLVVTPAGLVDHIQLVEDVKTMLLEKFQIDHSTIEIGLNPTPEHKH